MNTTISGTIKFPQRFETSENADGCDLFGFCSYELVTFSILKISCLPTFARNHGISLPMMIIDPLIVLITDVNRIVLLPNCPPVSCFYFLISPKNVLLIREELVCAGRGGGGEAQQLYYTAWA